MQRQMGQCLHFVSGFFSLKSPSYDKSPELEIMESY